MTVNVGDWKATVKNPKVSNHIHGGDHSGMGTVMCGVAISIGKKVGHGDRLLIAYLHVLSVLVVARTHNNPTKMAQFCFHFFGFVWLNGVFVCMVGAISIGIVERINSPFVICVIVDLSVRRSEESHVAAEELFRRRIEKLNRSM
jgi:hypothetical protein